MFWDGPANGSGTGDASIAEYDAATEFAGVMRSISGSGARVNQGGVFFGELQNLAVTSVGTSPATVAAGRGIAYGTWYENTAPVNVAIPTPSTNTRIDLIVFRKSWSAQTVRITRIAGVEGLGAPAMTQTVGTIWDIPLASVSITTGGIMTITDLRETGSVVGSALPAGPVSGGIAVAGVLTTASREDHTHRGLFVKYKTANQLKTAVVSIDTDLQCQVLNGKTYIFQVQLITVGGNDSAVGFIVPSGSTGVYIYAGLQTNPLTGVSLINQNSNPLITGTFIAGSNGTFGLNWGDNIGGGVTLMKFANMMAAEVA